MITKLIVKQSGNIQIVRRCYSLEVPNPLDPKKNMTVNYHQVDTTIEILDIDGLSYDKFISEVARDTIVVPLSVAASDIHEITDPVTGLTIDLSGAGVWEWFIKNYLSKAAPLLLLELQEDNGS